MESSPEPAPFRFPLYVKILGWFFLNIVILVLVFNFLLSIQFSFSLDWLLASNATRRIDAVKNLIVGELNTRPRKEWNGVLQRFNNAYGVKFLLVANNGTLLAGEKIEIPEEVVKRVAEPINSRRPFFASSKERPQPESGDSKGKGPPQPPPPVYPSYQAILSKFLVKTSNPDLYWLLIRTRVINPENSNFMRATLLVASSSMSEGGLLIDYKPWVAMGIGSVLFSALFWFPMVRSITRRIVQMTKITRQISEGNFDVRARVRGNDELGSLGQSINNMAGRLDGFVKGQKRFLGDIAHELCSPLARLQVALGILDERVDESNKKYVKSVSENSQQMADLVSELLSFSKASLGEKNLKIQSVNLLEIVEKSLKRENIEPDKIGIDVSERLGVVADPDLLLRALTNILRNSVRYAGTKNPILIQAERINGKVSMILSDSGPGVPEVDLQKIFDPFYRVDASRDRETGGIGLGLTIVRTCIESCGGTVMASNRKPSGLELKILLPAA